MESSKSIGKTKRTKVNTYRIVRTCSDRTTIEAAVRKMIAQHWKKG